VGRKLFTRIASFSLLHEFEFGKVEASGSTQSLSRCMSKRFTAIQPVGTQAGVALFDALDHTVDTKVRLLRPSGPDTDWAGMLAVFEALRRADSKRLEKVLDIGADQQGDFVVMDTPVGEPLPQILQEGPMTIAEFEQLATGLLNGLAAAHDFGLVHGAIRPSVVYVDRSEMKRWKICLRGFGLGFGETTLEGKGQVDAYRCAAPEQWEGAGARRRSDVWAAGCVLYEALAARPPFEAKTLKELRHKHLTNDVLPLGQLAPQVPSWVCDCVMKLMEHDPEKRPRKAGVALEIFLLGGAPPPPPPSAPSNPATVSIKIPGSVATTGIVAVPVSAAAMAPVTSAVPARVTAHVADPTTAPSTGPVVPRPVRAGVAPKTMQLSTAASPTGGVSTSLPKPKDKAETGGKAWLAFAIGGLILVVLLVVFLGRS
jgi:eukaryotic-like serine/threonine-protein kinase